MTPIAVKPASAQKEPVKPCTVGVPWSEVLGDERDDDLGGSGASDESEHAADAADLADILRRDGVDDGGEEGGQGEPEADAG